MPNYSECSTKNVSYEMLATFFFSGANSKALHYVKKMFSTISKLTLADLRQGEDLMTMMKASCRKEWSFCLTSECKSRVQTRVKTETQGHSKYWLFSKVAVVKKDIWNNNIFLIIIAIQKSEPLFHFKKIFQIKILKDFQTLDVQCWTLWKGAHHVV